jgi:DNA-binding PadR family transcriptional regulator
MFGRGDLKYGLLKLLEDRPKHGYEMIKELEDLTGGFYTPSAGAIYPTLQLLEDRGWVTVEVVEGKKVYTITQDGRTALAEYRQRAEERPEPGFGPWAWGRPERAERSHGPHHHHHHGPEGAFRWETRQEMRTLVHEARGVAHLMRQAVMASGGDPERLKQIQGIVERARGELTAFLEQQRASGPSSTPGDGPVTPPQAGEGEII